MTGTNRISRKKALEAKCKSCIYDPLSGLGTWREQVSRCSVYRCPLWGIRPTALSGPMAEAPPTPVEHLQWLQREEATNEQVA